MSILLTGVLTGCADPVESQRDTLEDRGYANVQIVEATKSPHLFSATVNGCTVHLFITQDKEQWSAMIVKTTSGEVLNRTHPSGSVTFEPAGTPQELKANPQFTAYCP